MSGRRTGSAAAPRRYNYRGVEPGLMTSLTFSEHQEEAYAAGFERLAAWADAALDVFRPELAQARCFFPPHNLPLFSSPRAARACLASAHE
jgi:hypothetical protein